MSRERLITVSLCSSNNCMASRMASKSASSRKDDVVVDAISFVVAAKGRPERTPRGSFERDAPVDLGREFFSETQR